MSGEHQIIIFQIQGIDDEAIRQHQLRIVDIAEELQNIQLSMKGSLVSQAGLQLEGSHRLKDEKRFQIAEGRRSERSLLLCYQLLYIVLICLVNLLMQSTQLTSSDLQKDQEEEFQIILPVKKEWIQINKGEQNTNRHQVKRKLVSIIVILIVFLLVGFFVVQTLPSFEKEEAGDSSIPLKIKSENRQPELPKASGIRNEDQREKQHQAETPDREKGTEIAQETSSKKNGEVPPTAEIKTASETKEEKIIPEGKTPSKEKAAPDVFPRVLWVQTDHELEIKAMEDALAAQNQIHFGKEGGFEVRVVNNLNAYNWLSTEAIAFVKETHQKSKVELPVYDLLRLALLYEHGGVFVRQNVLLMEGLAWVEDLMRAGSTLDEATRKVLSCQRADTKVVLIHESRTSGLWYKDDFIAAKPYAPLVKILMEKTADIVKAGVWPYSEYQITTVNSDTQATFFPWMTETLINVIHRKDSNICQNYSAQSFDADSGIFMASISDNLAPSVMKLSESAFKDQRGKKYLLMLNMHNLVNDIAHVIKTGDLADSSLLKNKLIMTEGSRWLATPSRKKRQVHFCIASLAPMPVTSYREQIKDQFAHLAKQTFANWNLVAFVENLPTVLEKAGEKTVLVNASAYEGLNLQRAATKYCDPASVMVLLDFDETFSSEGDLQTLADHFVHIGAFAAFVNLKTVKQVISPSGGVRGDVTRSVNRPNQAVISDIGNLMRAFTVEAYRFIASFDLYHSSTGRYFDRELPLLAVLELSEKFSPCESGNIVYQVRRFEELMAIPRQKIFPDITINTNRFKVADLTRFEYFAKFRQHDLCDAIKFCLRNYAQVEKLVVLNNGREEMGLPSRKGMPQLVPRKIHQIWVKGDMPNFKNYLMKRAREANPDYQYFLWGHQNFTRQNFPESYDLIQTLLEYDKKSPYSKMAMIADIARNEIVYRHGGFYLDTNYMLYGDRPLDKFLSYSLVSAGEVSPKQRVFKNQAFFSCTQFCPRLARIISHRALSSRNQFSKDAVMETGPAFFGKIQLGDEEQEENTFQPSFEEFYPNFIYDFPNINYNKCITPYTTPDDQVMFRSATRAYLKNCPEIYHYALGMDFWDEGFSWTRRRW